MATFAVSRPDKGSFHNVNEKILVPLTTRTRRIVNSLQSNFHFKAFRGGRNRVLNPSARDAAFKRPSDAATEVAPKPGANGAAPPGTLKVAAAATCNMIQWYWIKF